MAELEAVAAAEVTPDTNSSAPAEVSNPAFIWFLLVFFSRIYSWNIFKEKAPAEVVEASEEAMEAAAEEKPGTFILPYMYIVHQNC